MQELQEKLYLEGIIQVMDILQSIFKRISKTAIIKYLKLMNKFKSLLKHILFLLKTQRIKLLRKLEKYSNKWNWKAKIKTRIL